MDWKDCLRRAGLKQHQVASAIGTSESRLSRARHGRATLYPEELRLLAHVLSISIEEVNRLLRLQS